MTPGRRAGTRLAIALVALVTAGCLEAPPPLDPDPVAPSAAATAPATPSATPSAPAAAAPSDVPTVRSASLERAARELTLRVRTSGCSQIQTGSGFALDNNVLVTNRHVVESGARVQVNTWDGQSASASFVTAAFEEDLAIVRLDADLPRTAMLAAADPEPGEHVTIVGYPEGGAQELAQGEVVDYVRAISQGREIDSMRLTAEARPGNSGGPVLNDDGEVVGVVFALEVETGHTLAMPASSLRALLEAGEEIGAPVGC